MADRHASSRATDGSKASTTTSTTTSSAAAAGAGGGGKPTRVATPASAVADPPLHDQLQLLEHPLGVAADRAVALLHAATTSSSTNPNDNATLLLDVDACADAAVLMHMLRAPQQLPADPTAAQLAADTDRVVAAFDLLDPRWKTFLLMTLLRRTPRSSLQAVGSATLAALRTDIVARVPLEVAHRIFSFLDVASVFRCIAVSRRWAHVLLGEGGQNDIWKSRLIREQWFLIDEINDLIVAHNRVRGMDMEYILALGPNASSSSIAGHLSSSASNRYLSPAASFTAPLNTPPTVANSPTNGAAGRTKRARSQEVSNMLAVMDLEGNMEGITGSQQQPMEAIESSGSSIFNQEGIPNQGTASMATEQAPNTDDVPMDQGGEPFVRNNTQQQQFENQVAGIMATQQNSTVYDRNSRQHQQQHVKLLTGKGDGSTPVMVDVDVDLSRVFGSDNTPMLTGSWADSVQTLLRKTKRQALNITLNMEYPQLELPPRIYSNLYLRHREIRENWFKGKCRHVSFPGHDSHVVTCLQFDTDKIVSGSDDHSIHIYDTKGCYLRRELQGHQGGVWALQYWKDVLVSGSTDRSIRVWDMDTGEFTHVFDGHTSTVRCLIIVIPKLNPHTGKVEPKEPLIVTGSRDMTLRVWRLPNPKRDPRYKPEGSRSNNANEDLAAKNPYFKHVLKGHSASVRAIAGEGNTVVSGSYDHSVRVWDIETGKSQYVLNGHNEKVYSVGYSQELQRAVSGSMDNTVKVWCLKTGTMLFDLEGHSSLVGLLELTPKYLISAAADSTLRIWSPITGECLATLAGHSAAITCFHHIPEMNRIVSGADGGVKVWELCSNDYGEDAGVSPNTRVIPRQSSHRSTTVGGNNNGGVTSAAAAAAAAASAASAAAAHVAMQADPPLVPGAINSPNGGTPTVGQAQGQAVAATPILSQVTAAGGEDGVAEDSTFLNSRIENGREVVYGRFMRDLIGQVHGVWRVRMDEERLVCAVQRPGGIGMPPRTWFEVLHFGSKSPSTTRLELPGTEHHPSPSPPQSQQLPENPPQLPLPAVPSTRPPFSSATLSSSR